MYGLPAGLTLPIDKAQWQAAYRRQVRSDGNASRKELAAMTEEEAVRQINNLVAVGTPLRKRPDYSGFVQQQRLFMRARLINLTGYRWNISPLQISLAEPRPAPASGRISPNRVI